jgi:hypothetical protein
MDFKDALGRKQSIWRKMYNALPWQIRDLNFEFRMMRQRVNRGFDDRFWWSHHDTHSTMMVGMFDQFLKHHMGYPMMYECKHKKKRGGCDCGNKKWETDLKVMRDGFKAALEWEDLDYGKKSDKKRKLIEARFKKGMELYTRFYFNLWD